MSVSKPAVDYSVITAGNTGRGKSLLDNVLLRHEAFVHRFDFDSVTDKVECQEVMLDGKYRRVYNIPGLLESDVKKIERNKACLQKAFAVESKQAIVFVFGMIGGRPLPEDLAALQALRKAYNIQEKSLVCVFNRIPRVHCSDGGYQAGLLARVRRDLGEWELPNAVFVPELCDHTGQLPPNFFQSEECKQIHTQLWLAIDACEKVFHPQAAPVTLQHEMIEEMRNNQKKAEEEWEKDKARMQKALEDATKAIEAANRRADDAAKAAKSRFVGFELGPLGRVGVHLP